MVVATAKAAVLLGILQNLPTRGGKRGDTDQKDAKRGAEWRFASRPPMRIGGVLNRLNTGSLAGACPRLTAMALATVFRILSRIGATISCWTACSLEKQSRQTMDLLQDDLATTTGGREAYTHFFCVGFRGRKRRRFLEQSAVLLGFLRILPAPTGTKAAGIVRQLCERLTLAIVRIPSWPLCLCVRLKSLYHTPSFHFCIYRVETGNFGKRNWKRICFQAKTMRIYWQN